MGETFLLVISLGLLYVVLLNIWQSYELNRIRETIIMTTAEVIAKLDAAEALTTEIAADLDALIALVDSTDDVPAEIVDAIDALSNRLVDAAAKFTPEA